MGEKYPVALIKLTAESPMMLELEYNKVWNKQPNYKRMTYALKKNQGTKVGKLLKLRKAG